jgi:hypothetical protein
LLLIQGRLEAGSTCSKNTGAEGAAKLNREPNAKGKSAKREMNTVKFWLELALLLNNLKIYIFIKHDFVEISGKCIGKNK